MNPIQVRKPLFRLSLFRVDVAISNAVSYFQALSNPQKAIIVGVGTGAILIGVAARYFRRRKHVRKSVLAKTRLSKNRRNKPYVVQSPLNDYHSTPGDVSPGFHRSLFHRNSITIGSDKASITSYITGLIQSEADLLTPQQYGTMGMEALEKAINLWEEALSSYSSLGNHGMALPSQEASEFTLSLQKVIEEAYSLQDLCEHLFLHEHSILFRSTENSPLGSEAMYSERKVLNSYSSVESFVSAHGDIADIKNLEEFEDNPPSLYLMAVKHHEEQGIPYREVRTDRVKCASDVEYICKVHCLRLSSAYIFEQENNKEWFTEAGRRVIEGIMLKADKDPTDAVLAYEDLLGFLSDCNWQEIIEELKERGVPCVTFYDIVLDFILIDSFEDLENPPTSVYAVVQNRWLSNGFKESALATAVWSVLKAKRRMLKYQNGFVAHFYNITEHISPVFAWGFLGPDHRLRDVCYFFKDQIEGLLQDMFSFSTVRYTNVEDLSHDILLLARDRYKNLMDKITGSKTNGSCHVNLV